MNYEFTALPLSYQPLSLVRVAGLEPAYLSARDFKSLVYTIPPHSLYYYLNSYHI